MKKLKEYSKPLMITEEFVADQYVAICTMGAQYLYIDAVAGSGLLQDHPDGIYQDKHNVANWLEAIINILLIIFTNYHLNTDGEYTGVQTTANPTSKGRSYYALNNNNDPIYGSYDKLENGDPYNGVDLRGSLKINNNNEVYIQGNMS